MPAQEAFDGGTRPRRTRRAGRLALAWGTAIAVHAVAVTGMLLSVERASAPEPAAISVELVTWPAKRTAVRRAEPVERGPRRDQSRTAHDGPSVEGPGAPDALASTRPAGAAAPEPFRLRPRRVFCDQLADGGLTAGRRDACVERWTSTRDAYPELPGVPGELRLRWDAEVRRREAPMGKTIVPCDRDMAGSNLGVGCLPSD